MSRQSPFGHPFLLGFDEIEQALDRVAKAAGDGYPPYNIERLPRTERDPERLRITLAVAGFKPADIDITAQQNLLVVKGQRAENEDKNYVHIGIANRSFERRFELADFVRVENADMADGLLTIDLVREVPEAMKPKKIIVGQQPLSVVEHKDETKAA